MIFVVIANYFYGKDINKNMAVDFMKEIRFVFLNNFTHVGVTPEGPPEGPFLYEESPFTYQFWASGRKNMHYCKVEISVCFYGKLVLIFKVKETTRSHIPTLLEHPHAGQGQINHRNAFYHEKCSSNGFCSPKKEGMPKIPLKL